MSTNDDYTPTIDAVANAAVGSGYFDHPEVDRAIAAVKAEALREAAACAAEVVIARYGGSDFAHQVAGTVVGTLLARAATYEAVEATR